mmetsp:Transcript_27878/g.70986  ORF Transcript_27878/g.70986 Transcript_27878/m.70986 type:complete len:402 (-) Transcript_27878:437-1642(-)
MGVERAPLLSDHRREEDNLAQNARNEGIKENQDEESGQREKASTALRDLQAHVAREAFADVKREEKALNEFAVAPQRYTIRAPPPDSRLYKMKTVSKIFLVTVAVNVVAVLADQIIMMVDEIQDIGTNTGKAEGTRIKEAIWLFCLSFIVIAFVVYFAFDAVISDNMFQLVSFFAATILATARFIYINVEPASGEPQPGENGTLRFCNPPVAVLCHTMLGVVVAFQVAYIPFVILVYRASGRRFYAAAKVLHNMNLYTTYQIYLGFLRFDLTFQLLFGVSVMIWQIEGWYYVISALMLVLAIVWHTLAVIAIKRESVRLTYAVFALCWIYPITNIFCITNTVIGYLHQCDPAAEESCERNWFSQLGGAVSLGLYITLGETRVVCKYTVSSSAVQSARAIHP